jgi:hypothetical protein
MAFDSLSVEHPTLTRAATSLVGIVSRWHDEVRSAPGGSAWMHHRQFAERTENLAGHLDGVLVLADRGRHRSALALARTALEHHLLDRLLLLADRYEEIVRPEDPALIAEWEREWEQRSKPWTNDVVAVEWTSNGKALRLTRLGYAVAGDAGERISPYWVAMEHYDAFLGHPRQQPTTVRPFDDLQDRLEWARRNQALYGSYMRWSSVCHNLELNELVRPGELVQLQVQYGFLSAFVHATQSASDLHIRPNPGGPSVDHLLGELALLYVCTIAIAEIDTWATYIQARPQMLASLPPAVSDLVDESREIVAYFWFLGGGPQDFDRYQEANHRAHALLLAGRRPEIAPNQLTNEDVGYYDQPLERLLRMHTGGNELTTGFGFAPAWSALRW